MIKNFIISAILGIGLGILSNWGVFAGKWLNLIVWGIAGLILGLFLKNPKDSIHSGAVYGIFLTLSFLFSGFGGTPDKIPGFLLLTLGLTILGALCGILSVYVGYYIRYFARTMSLSK